MEIKERTSLKQIQECLEAPYKPEKVTETYWRDSRGKKWSTQEEADASNMANYLFINLIKTAEAQENTEEILSDVWHQLTQRIDNKANLYY